MKYVGSKRRYIKEILPLILSNREKGQYYVEPFVGGFNVMEHVNGNRIAADIHKYLIALYKAIQDGWIPPEEISEKLYRDLKDYPEKYPPQLVGFAGFGASFSGKWFGGYARGEERDYVKESRDNLLTQAPKLKGVLMVCCQYHQLQIPPNSIIYCDPPYESTLKYFTPHFISSHFWMWCRKLRENGHTVFVSEYNAPDDFECIWENRTLTHVCVNSKKNCVERLWIPR